MVLERARISSDPEAEHHQRVEREVAFDQRAARATLEVELESPCYPFEGWQALEIPEGHNWPENCDAFDRSLTVSLDDPDSPGARPPGLELLRAITPFGGPARFETDVTDVVNARPGAHRMRVEIGTYGDPEGQVSGARGEWIVSVALVLTPGEPERRVRSVEPLFFDVQTEAERAPVAFRVPEGTRSGPPIDYRVTGHGSALDPRCLGPAEEFCRRTHALSLDGAPLLELEPWRSDCAALCSPAHFAQGEQLRLLRREPVRRARERPCVARELVPRQRDSGVRDRGSRAFDRR